MVEGLARPAAAIRRLPVVRGQGRVRRRFDGRAAERHERVAPRCSPRAQSSLVLAVVAVWNALTYPSIGGYDAQEYITYARDLAERRVAFRRCRRLLHPSWVPGASPGVAGSIGRALDLHDPDHLGQLVNAFSVVGTGVIVLLLARTLWPARPVTWACRRRVLRVSSDRPEDGCDVPPGAARDADHGRSAARARAHGSNEDVLVEARRPARSPARGSVSWCAPGRSGWSPLRSSSSWSVALADRSLRQAALTARPGRVVLAALVARAVVRASGDPLLESGLRPPAGGRVPARPASADVLRRRGRSTMSCVVRGRVVSTTGSSRSSMRRRGATTSGSGRGDRARGDRTDEIDSSLARQSGSGSFRPVSRSPGSWRFSGSAVTRRREDVGRLDRRPAAVAAVVSMLYSRVAYPTSDGDTIKGTYALAAAPALALCFGFAVDVLARRRVVGVVLAVVLVGDRPGTASLRRLVSMLESPSTRRGGAAGGCSSVSASSCRCCALRSWLASCGADEPSFLEKVETCLTERATPFEDVSAEIPSRSSAGRGALRTTVDGNSVTVSLGRSGERCRATVYDAYTAVASAEVVATLLDRRRKVVFLWRREPTTAQREFMYPLHARRAGVVAARRRAAGVSAGASVRPWATSRRGRSSVRGCRRTSGSSPARLPPTRREAANRSAP